MITRRRDTAKGSRVISRSRPRRAMMRLLLPVEAAMKVRVIDPAKPAYVCEMPELPRYYDAFQHAPGEPVINVQSVIWSPGDADAAVTITVG